MQQLNKIQSGYGYLPLQELRINNPGHVVKGCEVEIYVTDIDKKWEPRRNDGNSWDFRKSTLKTVCNRDSTC